MSKAHKRLLATMFFWALPFYLLMAQQVIQSTPLHAFFQHNYDSTIIYQSGSSWNRSPHYLIIAKQKEQLYFFTYTSPYRDLLGRYYPGNLAPKLARAEDRFRRMIPDTNYYFLPKPILSATLLRSWKRLKPHQFWLVQDDQKTLQSTASCMIDDGDENTFYLIDKKAIKIASFYAPAYWEECLGKDAGRRQAIGAIELLRALGQQKDTR